jgi:hypothetical protein
VLELDPQAWRKPQGLLKEASTALLGVLGTVSRGGQLWSPVAEPVLIPVVTLPLRDWDKLTAGVLACCRAVWSRP